jgi:hypothetical protein
MPFLTLPPLAPAWPKNPIRSNIAVNFAKFIG